MLEVGRIAKSHGLKGEVIVELFTNVNERVARGFELHSDHGILVVERSTPHQHRWLVKFVGIDSREQADELHSVLLSAEEIDDPNSDTLWIHKLIGATVVDVEDVNRGVVKNVLANPAGDILETDHGHLVPLRFVKSFDGEQIVVEVPEGLFDL